MSFSSSVEGKEQSLRITTVFSKPTPATGLNLPCSSRVLAQHKVMEGPPVRGLALYQNWLEAFVETT